MNRSSQEKKLTDFLTETDEVRSCEPRGVQISVTLLDSQVFLELKHQEQLKHLGLAAIYSRANQNIASWITFCINMLINLLFTWVSFRRKTRPRHIQQPLAFS